MAGYVIPTERAALERRIVERAQQDPAFRDRLLSRPREAVAELLGVPLPERLDVQVVQERPDSLCIVLPVDLTGLSYDAVWSMIGHRPSGERPQQP